MGRVMSIVGVPMLLAPVLGPVIGGAIVKNMCWRWIFFVNLPVGHRSASLLAARLMPAAGARPGRGGRHEPTRLDWRGLALVSPGVARDRLRHLTSTRAPHARAPSAWLPLALGVLARRRVRRPRVARRAIRSSTSRLFRRAASPPRRRRSSSTGIALFGSMILLPLYYQIARGESPLMAGLLVAPQGLGAALGMNLGGRATDRYGGGAWSSSGSLPDGRHGDLHPGRRRPRRTG